MRGRGGARVECDCPVTASICEEDENKVIRRYDKDMIYGYIIYYFKRYKEIRR